MCPWRKCTSVTCCCCRTTVGAVAKADLWWWWWSSLMRGNSQPQNPVSTLGGRFQEGVPAYRRGRPEPFFEEI